MTEQLTIDKGKTALIVIDLQKGIAFPSRPAKPHTVNEVVTNAARLATAFREKHMSVFLAHLVPTPETALRTIADITIPRPPGPMPVGFADFVPEIKNTL
jgi:nicotinamidase-related amidase